MKKIKLLLKLCLILSLIIIGAPASATTVYAKENSTVVTHKTLTHEILGDNNTTEIVRLTSKVIKVEDGAFSGLTALKEIRVDSGNRYYASCNGCLYNKNYTVLICIPRNVASIQIKTSITSYAPHALDGFAQPLKDTLDRFIDINKSTKRSNDNTKNTNTTSVNNSKSQKNSMATRSKGSSSKQTVYVISKIEKTYTDDDDDDRTFVREFTYNSKGLMTTGNWLGWDVSFKYRKDNQLKKATVLIEDQFLYWKYYYDKNGRRSMVVLESEGYGKESFVEKYTYDKKGRLKKMGNKLFKYSGKKISKIGEVGQDYDTVEYDDNGNISSIGDFHLYKNYYEDGKLTKRLLEVGGYPEFEIVYTYKKIEVDKKYVDLIKQQQWSLLNDDIDEYFTAASGMIMGTHAA